MNYFDQDSSMPLTVFETGGEGAADVENWVGGKHGVLITSAKTVLRWISEDGKISGDEFGRYEQLGCVTVS